MATINKKSGETRKNSSPGRTLFNFKMLDEIKFRLEVFSFVKGDSMAGMIEKCLLEYMRKEFNHIQKSKSREADFETQLIRNIIHKRIIQETGNNKIDYMSKEVTNALNEFFKLPEYQEPSYKFSLTKSGNYYKVDDLDNAGKRSTSTVIDILEEKPKKSNKKP